MDGHEGETVAELLFDHIKEKFRLKLCRISVLSNGLFEGLIEGYVTHRQAGGPKHLSSDQVHVAGGREFHQGIGTFGLGRPGLVDFLVQVADIGRGADGGVNLGPQTTADTDNFLVPALGIAGNDNLSPGNIFQDLFLR